MASERSNKKDGKGKESQPPSGEWTYSKCSNNDLLNLVSKGSLQGKDLFNWRPSFCQSLPIENVDEIISFYHFAEWGLALPVAEPPELFRLKCASHRYLADTNSTHFKRNNPLVCRVFARYNHGSAGSKQVYLARRRVYNHGTTHQLLIYRYSNIITNLVQTQSKTYTNSV
jgi:hypothetical protein